MVYGIQWVDETVTQPAENASRHRVCRVEDLPDGEGKAFDVEGRSIAIFSSGGKFFAYRNVCPHLYAPICHGRIGGTMIPSEPGEFVYGLEGQVVRCPWHNWEFELSTGRSMFTNDRRRLAPVQLAVEGGWVYADVQHPGRRPPQAGSS